MANGDAPGDGPAGGAASGSGDEAAWLDLVARFAAPAPADGDGATPWPEREDLNDSVPVTPAAPDRPGTGAPGTGVPGPAAPGTGTPATGTPVTEPPTNPGMRLPAAGPGRGPRDTPAPRNPDDDHYVPPPPPPLPKVNPVTKMAWLALFGGPCYLLISTAVGWSVSGLAAFICIAAFIGGFAVLVIRMDNRGPGDSGPDDGAVV